MATLLRRLRLGRDQRAAQPGLSRRRVRVLPVRPPGQGADRRSRAATRRPSRWRAKLGVPHRRSGGRRRRARRQLPPRRARRRGAAGAAPRRRLREAGRRRAGAAHLGHDLAAEDRAAAQRNLAASARQHRARRCASRRPTVGLNIMPLFHIHGLIAGVLAPLSAGALGLLHAGLQRAASSSPGWTRPTRPGTRRCRRCTRRSCRAPSATPRCIAREPAALHPLVVVVAAAAGDRRSSRRRSAAPVIEAYGMTEAAHQMASNPLPPGARKPGTVGLAAGPEVAIMDDGRRAARRRRDRRDRHPRRRT